MPEYMVSMDITFPQEMDVTAIKAVLDAEAVAARPYLDSGQFNRAWARYGEHVGSHGHLALWTMDQGDWALRENASAYQASRIRAIYEGWPLAQGGYTSNLVITELLVNPNDQHQPATAPFLTYANLRAYLTDKGHAASGHGEGLTADLVPGVSIHDHPMSGRNREIHFMVDGQKIAEIGPPTGSEQENAPGYIDLLAEWLGKPVAHDRWKARILRITACCTVPTRTR